MQCAARQKDTVMSQPLPTTTETTEENVTEESVLDELTGTFLEPLIAELITGLGEDVNREGLLKTPERVDRSLRFLTSGYGLELKSVINEALFQAEGSELVVVRDIEFYSLCEHHMLPFFGRAHIAYLPDRTILGLSKFARIVDMFARRLQVQERLTTEIADAVVETLAPKGVAVVTEASHLCMMMRGVQKQESVTRTVTTRGVFRDDVVLRREVLDALK